MLKTVWKGAHVSMDYGFSGAVLVPRRRTEYAWITQRAKFIDQLGHNRVTLRCDNEPIEAFAREIIKREGRPFREDRQWGERQSIWIIERAPGLVVGQSTSLKAALEHRIGTRVPPDARILCRLVEFAAFLMNGCDTGSDGKTQLHRLHGRKDNTLILQFKEKILYMPAKPARGGKWEPRFPIMCFLFISFMSFFIFMSHVMYCTPIEQSSPLKKVGTEFILHSERRQRQWLSPSEGRRSRHAQRTSG